MTEKEFISSWASRIYAEGIKTFPDDFHKFDDFYEADLPGKTLIIGQEFFGNYEILTIDGSLIFRAENYSKAKFIIYSNRQKPKKIKIPKEEITLKAVVSSYEEYVDGIIKRIESDLKKNFPGSNTSGEVTNNILRILNLTRY